MVRRDDVGALPAEGVGKPASSCEGPAGESPASVSAGAPSSRPAVTGEIQRPRPGDESARGSEELCSAKRARGPQLHVKSAASKDEQSEGRAAHLAAKATAATRAPERGDDLGGVRDAARVQGHSRNTRDPSALSLSRLGASHKPKAKASAAQRKSEGVVVPMMAASNNAAGGKGHEGGCVGEEGKREGMTARSNSPERHVPVDKVRQLQRRRWTAAKRSPERRFHALYDQCTDCLDVDARLLLEPRSASLRGTVKYPETVQYRWSESPLVSRVQEIHMRGFEGVVRKPTRKVGESRSTDG